MFCLLGRGSNPPTSPFCGFTPILQMTERVDISVVNSKKWPKSLLIEISIGYIVSTSTDIRYILEISIILTDISNPTYIRIM